MSLLAASPSDDPPRATVAVRALCEFAARQGDLDHRFTPAPSAEEGIAGHQAIARRRGDGWRAEVPLEGRHRHLRVRGRADGVHEARALVEEVKTCRGNAAAIPPNQRALHRAQAMVYAALWCAEHGAPACNVAVVYVDIDRDHEECSDVTRHSAAELQQFFEALCERYLAWADRELAHRARRDAALKPLAFVHAFRDGQRQLAESVFVAVRRGRLLLAQAPTGIGKTLGTLFPALKAMPEQAVDKLFFLTAKGSGRAAALHALQTLRGGGDEGALPLRIVELTARDKACEHPDKACHGDACPLARGFFDRLPAARDEAVAGDAPLTRDALRELARHHAVCPYYLSQELARWADVVVGDYNHVFDHGALLHGLTLADGLRSVVLVDEAHNLIERSRDNFSARLDPAELRAARAAAPVSLHKPLDRLRRAWSALAQEDDAPYRVLPALPARLDKAMRALIEAIGGHLAEAPRAPPEPALLALYFVLLHVARLLEAYDASHSLIDLVRDLVRDPVPDTGREAPSRRRRPALPVLTLRNVIPAPFLKPRFAAMHATVLFSATLAPMPYYADTLGLPDEAAWLEVDSPFSPAQLAVRVVPSLSTRWRDRAASVAPIVRLIGEQFTRQPGNYLAFFASHDYLAQVADAFIERYPDVPAWRQARRMDEAERAAFTARFVPGGAGIGFAVLGGLFAEGVDLPGTRLIGAFIATLGLPQLNPVNEALRERLQQRFGQGFEYAYLYPGLRKVVQAAGRVVRTPEDTGTLHLIDDRFGRADVRRLLPGWWQCEVLRSA